MLICCIWYDFVSYSQLPAILLQHLHVVYDTILSAIHNYRQCYGRYSIVVYDTILSAIHNHSFYAVPIPNVVYDTILSAIHNNLVCFIFSFKLYMIWFCQYVKELSSTIIRCRCKDKEKAIIFKILSDKKSCRIIFFCIFASKNQIWRINGYFKENRVS